jgi:hypothetical protein
MESKPRPLLAEVSDLPVLAHGIGARIAASGRSRTSERNGSALGAGTSFAPSGSFRNMGCESGLFEATADELHSGENC